MKITIKPNETKSIQKSIRMMPTIYEWLNKQSGNGFNEKLENTIVKFMNSEADLNKKITDLQKQIMVLSSQEKEKRETVCYSLNNLQSILSNMERQLKNVENSFVEK